MTENIENQKMDKSQVKKFKRKVKDAIKNKGDQIQSMTDAQWIPRWQRICDGEIDWNNPYVKVEKTLNNIKVQAILTNQRMSVEERHEKVRPLFPDEETYQLYLTGIQPLDPDHTPYTYIETKSMTRQYMYHVKNKIKRK